MLGLRSNQQPSNTPKHSKYTPAKPNLVSNGATAPVPRKESLPSPADGGGFDKLLGLAARGKPIVKNRSNNSAIGEEEAPPPPPPETNYDALPSLSEVPSVGCEIAFRVLEVLDNYTPGLSEYKVGKVVAVGERGDVTIEVNAVRKRRNGKFELGGGDDGEDGAIATETL